MGRRSDETKLVRRIPMDSLSNNIVEGIGWWGNNGRFQSGNEFVGGIVGDCDRCHCDALKNGKGVIRRYVGR